MRKSHRDVTLAVEDRHWWYRGRRRVLRTALESLPLPPQARCLDAGCGGGANLTELARFGTVVGLEPSDEAFEAARARGVGQVVLGHVEEMPFADAEFDVAAALDVIEHLDDDRAGLRELRRVVRPTGFLVVTVPAYPRLWGPHDLVNDHRRRYVRKTLLAAARDAGWTPRLISNFNSVLLPPAAIRRIRDRRDAPDVAVSDFQRTPAAVDRVLELPLRLEARALSAGIRLPAGLSILAIFEPVA